MSPLLFSLFINNLGSLLNSTGLGINLANINISGIFFADDLIILGQSKTALDTLMMITRKFFKNHHLSISETKSKIMTHDASTGETSFPSSSDLPPLNLEAVCSFKYLGIPLNSSPRNLFKDFNLQVRKRANNYLSSVLSLVRAGPDRSTLAYTLWTSCALPSILYGTEVMPLTDCTIAEVERCNTMVGKFILQVPRSSADTAAYIDAGLRPIWSLIAEKVILYASSTMSQPSSYWPKIAMSVNLADGPQSPYTRYLLKWKGATGCFGLPPKQIKSAIKRTAITSVLDQQRSTSTSTFAMTGPSSSSFNSWFKTKSWVTDSGSSKIIAQFRICNSGLGNRGPANNGQFYKLCPLCLKSGTTALNNEVGLYLKIILHNSNF